MADHCDQAQLRVGHVDVAVAALRRPVGTAHVLGEDSPGLDAAHDVDAHVAVQRRTDIVGAHGSCDADRRALVAATRVERARNLALPIENVAALLDAARQHHAAVDAEQVLAVEARLADLFQRAEWLGFPGDRHGGATLTIGATIAPWGRRPTGFARSAGRCSATGSRSAWAAAPRVVGSRSSRMRFPTSAHTARGACSVVAPRA